MSLVSTSRARAAGAVETVRAWAFSIKVHMNSWKKSFGEATRAGTGIGTEPRAGASEPEV